MIKDYTKKEAELYLQSLLEKYNECKSLNLHLDMSRGKPCKDQLDISEGLLSVLSKSEECVLEDGIDCRNYGGLAGIPEARKLFADIMGVTSEEVIVGGNSSLNMMYDTITRAMLFGVFGGSKPWGQQGKIKFLCPVPGYDRHFTICNTFGIQMINIPLGEDGPDMNEVRRYVENDSSVKGIWCVPKYSNPDGITYSQETVKAFAMLKPAADDFRIFWDNAYVVHCFSETDDYLENIMDELKKTGKEDMVFMYSSTSKVSFPGAGVAAMAASKNNIDYILKQMFPQTIGPDKINQLRHVRYYKNADGYRDYMKKHAAIIAPRFSIVTSTLERELGGEGIAKWTKPNGGYFISLFVMKNCAKRVVKLLSDVGVKMTSAGATYPYGIDPDDSNIRIAPTYPPEDELKQAIAILCLCVKIAACEKIISQ